MVIDAKQLGSQQTDLSLMSETNALFLAIHTQDMLLRWTLGLILIDPVIAMYEAFFLDIQLDQS